MNSERQIQEVKSATLLRFHEIWKQNFQNNLNTIQRNPGVSALRNKFKGLPAIVIGAGPSLDKNIKFLSQAKDKAVLISSDAAFKPLLSHDVIPSLVVSLAPQEEITKFFTGVSHHGITLVAPSIVHP